MDAGKEAQRLIQWLQERVREAGAAGLIVGLSGGVDSAVVAALCSKAFPGNCLGLIMPCHSDPQDASDALLAAEALGIQVKRYDLQGFYDDLLRQFGGSGESREGKMARGNLKPRLRMLTLYYHAASLNYLVAGTGNRSELFIGYFTKYGDGGVDLLPIGHLVKTQVRDLARRLDVPEPIITKPPSAGLWEGQTDEGEMGFTYSQLDRYILTGEAEPAVREKIEALAACARHKLSPLPIPGQAL